MVFAAERHAQAPLFFRLRSPNVEAGFTRGLAELRSRGCQSEAKRRGMKISIEFCVV